MSNVSVEDRLRVPLELSQRHSSLPQQSIVVLNQTVSEEHALIRILLGTATLVDRSIDKRYTLDTNYSVLGRPKVAGRTYKTVEQLLAIYELEVEEVDLLLRRSLIQRTYFANLLAEITGAICRSRRGHHTVAFLHLYRFLEHISFAFPVLYAARANAFTDAFQQLKSYFSDADKKELGFFRKFVESAIEAELRERTSTIDVRNIEGAFRDKIFSSLCKQVARHDIVSQADYQLVLKNDAILDLCVNLRNRYFHFTATNSSNISLSNIGDSDWMFSAVNEHILNWLSVIYFETLKHRISAA